MKIVFKGIVILSLFFVIFYGFKQIDFVKIAKVEGNRGELEQKLGRLIWDSVSKSHIIIEDVYINKTVDTIVDKICLSNKIDRSKVKIHIVRDNEINAFTLPMGHILINSGLISSCQNVDQLVGILSHEIAHIELDHIMKSIITEIGITALVSMITGDGVIVANQRVIELLSSSLLSQAMEKDADMKAVEYMINTNVNPRELANFMLILSVNNDIGILNWISSHPDSKSRFDYINNYLEGEVFEYSSIIDEMTWYELRSKLFLDKIN